MVAGLHAFMDNTGVIPLLFNAKKNTEILRNTAKKMERVCIGIRQVVSKRIGGKRNGEMLPIPWYICLLGIDGWKATIAICCGDKTQRVP